MTVLDFLKPFNSNDIILYRFKNCSSIYSSNKAELLKKDLIKDNKLKVIHNSYNFIVIDFN